MIHSLFQNIVRKYYTGGFMPLQPVRAEKLMVLFKTRVEYMHLKFHILKFNFVFCIILCEYFKILPFFYIFLKSLINKKIQLIMLTRRHIFHIFTN